MDTPVESVGAPAAAPPPRRPPPLRRQIVLLLAVVTAVAVLVLVQASTQRVQQAANAAQEEWVTALARAAAGQAAASLFNDDAEAVAATLREIAAMPAIEQVHVRDRQGRTLLVLAQASDGRVVRRQAAVDAAPPGSADGAIRSWAGAGPGGSLGSVGITYRADPDHHPFARLRYDVLVATALVGLLMLLAASWFVSRAVAPLQRLARFSREIGAGDGRRIELHARSQEVAELAEALNHASQTMRSQLAALHARDSAQEALLNAVPDVLIGLDGEGHVQIVNPGLAAVFGLQPEDAIGLALQQLLPGITAEEAEERTLQGLYMRSTRSHVARFEIEAQRRDGTPFPAEVSLSRIETPDGPRYAALVRDMTETRMTLSMLNLYSRALECTTNGIVISDISVAGQPVFYANPAFARITGYGPGEAIGRNCAFLQREDQAQPEIDELRQAVAERRATQVVVRNYRKDGTLFFNELAIAPVADSSGDVRYYVGVLNDVTERERARMAIAERSARLNAVFDLSPDGFVVFDRDGRLAYSNRAFLAMTGWSRSADLQGLDIAAFEARLAEQCDPQQRGRPLAEVLAEEEGHLTPDTLFLMRPERRVLARLARSQRSGHVETILFFRDITRETEVDRMKNEFLTTAAHELRTPMVSVFGFTELLLRRPVPEERRRDMLETIHRQSSLLIKMVNELLDLARIEARQGKDLKRELCRVDGLLHEATEPVRLQDSRCPVVMDVAHGDTLLLVDPAKTQQALGNVLSNAVKYSPQGGTIIVSTQRGEIDGRPAVGLRISDQGIGMTPEQVARVFERFYRADPSGNIPGTGLGMSLVKEIVELQDGRVELDSAPGRGTRVTLWFPCATAADMAASLSGTAAASLAH